MPSQYLIILSIVGWGIGSLFYKVANTNIHPLMVSAIVTAIYIILTPIPFLIFKFDTHVNSTGLLFSILGGLCMCAGSIGYFYALRQGDAGVVTALTSLYPALTMMLSVFFMKEVIGTKQIIGMSLAIASFICLSLK